MTETEIHKLTDRSSDSLSIHNVGHETGPYRLIFESVAQYGKAPVAVYVEPKDWQKIVAAVEAVPGFAIARVDFEATCAELRKMIDSQANTIAERGRTIEGFRGETSEAREALAVQVKACGRLSAEIGDWERLTGTQSPGTAAAMLSANGVQGLRADLAAMHGILRERDKTISDQGAKIQELDQRNRNQENLLNQRDRELSAQRTELGATRGVLLSRDETVKDLRQTLAERGVTIACSRNELYGWEQATGRPNAAAAAQTLAELRGANATLRSEVERLTSELAASRNTIASLDRTTKAQNRAPADEPTAKARATLQEKVSLMFTACPAACSLTEESGRPGFAKHLWGLWEALRMIPRGPYGSNPGDGKTVSIDEPAPAAPPAVAQAPAADPIAQERADAKARQDYAFRSVQHREKCDGLSAKVSSKGVQIRGDAVLTPDAWKRLSTYVNAIPGLDCSGSWKLLPHAPWRDIVLPSHGLRLIGIDPGALASGCSVTFSGDSAPTGGDGDDEGDEEEIGPCERFEEIALAMAEEADDARTGGDPEQARQWATVAAVLVAAAKDLR